MSEEMNDTETGEEIQDPFALLGSTPMEVEAPTPQAHRGTVEGLSLETFDSGATAIKFALKSVDTGADHEYTLFLPLDFVADIHLDPTDLPSEKGNNQKMSYTIGISNSDQTATMQELRTFAAAQNRTLPEDVEAPTNISEWSDLHAAIFTGIELVYLLRPDTKADEPAFRNRLRVTGFRSIDVVGNPKMLKKYRRMWEEV